jgi:alkylation response protein AidB-like acyl-CoA dehydrogenase
MTGLVPAEHERDLAATLRELCSDQLDSPALRTCIETTEGYPAGLWKAVAQDIGLCGLTVPESLGGLGLGMLEANTVHVELGRSLFPAPFLSTSLATTAILAGGSADVAERWLPAVAAGECIATVAAGAGASRAVGSDRGSTAAPGRDGAAAAGVAADAQGRLSGRAQFVPYAHAADLLLVATGHTVFAVEPGAGVTVTQLRGLDLTRRLCTVDLADVAGTPIGDATAVGDAVSAHLRLALAAEAVGGLEWCLDTVVEYAKTREQFGRKIGSFQAVAHQCVNLYSEVRSVSAAARWAAHAAATGDAEAELSGYVAALRAADAYRTQTEAAVHLLGGIGFTWEHDIHLYYRRARSALALAGGLAFLRERVATAAGLDTPA